MMAVAQPHSAEASLARVLEILRNLGYHFVTPTPASHSIVIQRSSKREAGSLIDIFGWSLPFRRQMIDPEIFDLLQKAACLAQISNDLWRSEIRVSSLRGNLYLHSAFPTDAHDSVFFGPDSYRFADAILTELGQAGLGGGSKILDIGTGSGVGAIVAGAACANPTITMTDINAKAIAYAMVNTANAGIVAHGIVDGDLSQVADEQHLILANPPYIVDPAGRAYRDGGAFHGSEVALFMTQMALARLAPGGRFLLYTGSTIVNGEDRLHDKLLARAAEAQCDLRYREIDPDVFGEELSNPAYYDVDRIAAIVAVFSASGACQYRSTRNKAQ